MPDIARSNRRSVAAERASEQVGELSDGELVVLIERAWRELRRRSRVR